MNKELFDTPILFLVFNRPEATEKVFAEIRKIRPKYFFVAADGPRADKKGEEFLCHEVRKIISSVDWDCEIKTLFNTNNLGCKAAVSNAIDWFFSYVEEGIILEDDCLPSSSFFEFMSNALSFYRQDLSIWHIDGSNFNPKSKSVTFSKFPLIWGWATWRNRWEYYSVQIEKNDSIEVISSTFKNLLVKNYWINRFKDFFRYDINTWDYQWMLTVWRYNGIVVRPEKNLIKNIGFGNAATHTKDIQDYLIIENNQLALTHDFPEYHNRRRVTKEDFSQFINRFMKRSYLYGFLFFLKEKIKK